MTKQDLINSYPVSHFSYETFIVWTFIVGVVLAIGAAILTRKDEYSFKYYFNAFFFAIFIGLIITLSASVINSTNIYDKTSQWEKTFFVKYLPTVEDERLNIVSKVLNENGTITVIVQTNHNKKSISQISDIEYFNPNVTQQTAYVTARYVDGFSKTSVLDGFYDAVIYLPEEKRN